MTVMKKLKNVYLSETFAIRIDKGGKTELSLMQKTAFKSMSTKVMIDSN